MLKNISLFILLLFCCGLTKAQNEDFKKELDVGVNFGANMASASFGTSFSSEPFKTKMWQRWTGGISMRYIVEKNLGLIVELNYSQQGWEQDFSDADATPAQQEFLSTLSHRHELNYLQIPFLTHIYFGNKVRFVFNLGPEVSFLINEKEIINKPLQDYLASGNISSGTMTAQYYRKADRKFEYGILGGLGLEFRTGIGLFVLEGRYVFGLSDFFNNTKADPFQQSANRTISVKATYYIKLF